MQNRKERKGLGQQAGRLPTKLSTKEKSSIEGVLMRKKEIKACLNCGGTNLRVVAATKDQTSLSAAQKPDVYGAYSCSDCGKQGAPIIFKSFSAYERFYVSKRQKYNMRLDQQEASYFLANPFAAGVRRDPALAFILNLILPGVGYSYIGQRRKAWVFMAFIAVYFFELWLLLPYARVFGILPFMAYALFMLLSSFDAYVSAKKTEGK